MFALAHIRSESKMFHFTYKKIIFNESTGTEEEYLFPVV